MHELENKKEKKRRRRVAVAIKKTIRIDKHFCWYNNEGSDRTNHARKLLVFEGHGHLSSFQ